MMISYLKWMWQVLKQFLKRRRSQIYDIKFKVKLPTQEEAELIINLESQNKYRPGYTLEKRGIYYLSRLISS